MKYPASRIIMAVTATGVLTFTTACTTSGASTQQYAIRESGVQVLQTEHSDCNTDRGAAETAEKVRFTLTSAQDVDTAYTRLKRAFGFQAPDERAPAADIRHAPPPRDTTYLYRIAPGVAYRMRERRPIDGHTGVIQIDIERDGNGSRLAVLYYAGGKNQFPRGEGFRRFIEAKIREALRPDATAAKPLLGPDFRVSKQHGQSVHSNWVSLRTVAIQASSGGPGKHQAVAQLQLKAGQGRNARVGYHTATL